MKNINWGWRIVILYSSFVVLILFLVYKTTTVKDDLVTPDYYAKELKFQEHLDKQKRTHDLKEQLSWSVKGKNISIRFPEEIRAKNVKAEILFYNTAEAKKDLSITCAPDPTGVCDVSSEKLSHGIYQMQIDWSAGGITYYNEGVIKIN